MLSEDNTRRYTEPPQLDEAGLVAFLATQEDIVAAYLFGSLAQGRATPRSDLDIAVLLRRIPDPQSDDLFPQFRLMDELRRFADREVDVVILNTAPPVLKDQVLRHGRRVFERDRPARVEFEVRTGQEYADLKPMYDLFAQTLIAELKEAGLGDGDAIRDYARIDDAKVHEILKRRLGDSDAFAGAIVAYLDGA